MQVGQSQSVNKVGLHCRALREEMYRANITRASSGEQDNSPLIEKVLTLKQEKAKLLGYANFAEVSMASKVLQVQHVQLVLRLCCSC